MTGGYAGKILRVNLTNKSISTIDTARYEELGGGFGMGAAIFWDLAVAPGQWDLQDAYDPRNVISLMSGPLAATGAPAAGRTSVCGVGSSTYPTDQFYRTNFGGRFATTLKLAGWDGVVLEGKADKPVWINIINDKVTIEDARPLWGLDTWETQNRIVSMVGGRTRFGEEWQQIGEGYTTARPQIVCIGPVGEARARVGALIHGSGVTGRQGGFGGVFGAKNLKAISVTGTGSIRAADPRGVVDTRIWHVQKFPRIKTVLPGTAACMPCINDDRIRDSYPGGEAMCDDTYWYGVGKSKELQMKGAEILMRWGVGSFLAAFGNFKVRAPEAPPPAAKDVPGGAGLGWYVKYLYEIGVLGPGKQIDSSPLPPIGQCDELEFREAFFNAIARRAGIGDALAEGTLHAAKRWGRLDEDVQSGALRYPAWGSTYHWNLPGVEWAFGGLLGSGDVVWHVLGGLGGKEGNRPYTLETLLEIMSSKTIPYTGDPYMFSFAWKGEEAKTTGIYSEHKAKLVAWSRHYADFWNESMAFCEWMLATFLKIRSGPVKLKTQESDFSEVMGMEPVKVEPNTDFRGPTPEAEMRYYQAVTGNKVAFADTMEVGRKIWNLERAIRVMQGRHRNQEKFYPFMYRPGASQAPELGGRPVYEHGTWSWQPLADMHLDEAGVELFKTNFYKLEGWGVDTGWPTRKTLEGLGLKRVADTLGSKGKLGA
jgi:aldehyde:ferredoxin oxidoreductase